MCYSSKESKSPWAFFSAYFLEDLIPQWRFGRSPGSNFDVFLSQ